jgi:cysteinyl-tRNA synthetase
MNQKLRMRPDYTWMNQAYYLINKFLLILGLEFDLHPLTAEERDLLTAWDTARVNKDFQQADRLRNELVERGLI